MNASDATADVVDLQLDYDLGAIDWARLRSSEDKEQTVKSAGALLGVGE